MTIDEAIKILHQDLGADTYDNYLGLYGAQKLGLAALQRIRWYRGKCISPLDKPLPGETEVSNK